MEAPIDSAELMHLLLRAGARVRILIEKHELRALSVIGAAESKSTEGGRLSRPLGDLERAYGLRGGGQVTYAAICNSLDVHDLIICGLPSESLLFLAKEAPVLSQGDTFKRVVWG